MCLLKNKKLKCFFFLAEMKGGDRRKTLNSCFFLKRKLFLFYPISVRFCKLKISLKTHRDTYIKFCFCSIEIVYLGQLPRNNRAYLLVAESIPTKILTLIQTNTLAKN